MVRLVPLILMLSATALSAENHGPTSGAAIDLIDPPDVAIDDTVPTLRLNFTVKALEEYVSLSWDYPAGELDLTIEKQAMPLAMMAVIDNLESIDAESGGGWTELATGFSGNTFNDTEVAPISPDIPAEQQFSFPQAYCYRLSGMVGDRAAVGTATCVRDRGLDAPLIVRAEPLGSTDMRIVWDDLSELENAQRIRWRPEGGAMSEPISLPADIEEFIITGMVPDTDYLVFLTAFDIRGRASGTLRSIKTDPVKETALITMTRRRDMAGAYFYNATLPVPEGLDSSRLITLSGEVPGFADAPLMYLSEGTNNTFCDVSLPFIVSFGPTRTLNRFDMENVFDQLEPSLPRSIRACVPDQSADLPETLEVQMTYTVPQG